MDHHQSSPEVTVHHEPGGKEVVQKIIRTTVILSVITLIELALGFGMYLMPDLSSAIVLFIKGAIVILSLLKAFYIVGVFMHLGEEIKNLIMTIIVPLLLFVWFIAAFLWDGSSWRELRNTQGKSKTEQVVNSKGVENKTPAVQH
jgi:cytochrome c oxidase subunit 4